MSALFYIHPEADQQVTRTLDVIKSKGKKAGIALNPGTSIATVKELLPLVDYVMVMTVNPGFAGQSFLDFTVDKIDELVALSENYNYDVMVDGAIAPDKVESLSEKGVKGFILGTSSLFGKEESYETILQKLR